MTLTRPCPAAAIGCLLALAGCTGEERGRAAADPTSAEPGVADPAFWPEVRSPVARSEALEERITALIAAMTPAQKVGQVIQADIASITPEEAGRYRIGAVLNGGDSAPGGGKYAAPSVWLAAADAFHDAALAGGEGPVIPILWGSDAVHGHNNVVGATIFPHNVGLGATRNPELIREIGRITALEMRVTGIGWTFAPTVAVARDDRWGRTYESFSEDAELVSGTARAMIEGLQGRPGGQAYLQNERVIATAKHFIGDGGTTNGEDQGDNRASEQELRDVHGAPYVAAVEAGAQVVMASYSSWHGRKSHGNESLLVGVLKQRMGFDGFVVGDWNGHAQLPGCSPGSCPEAFNAGIDMYMVPNDWRALRASLMTQVADGSIPQPRLDEAVRRILRVKLRAGLFEAPRPSARPLAGRFELLGSAEHRAVARHAVRESLVLLENDGVLPIAHGARVLVAGDAADSVARQSGGRTLSWQGTQTRPEDFPNAETVYAGIAAAAETAGGVAELRPDGDYETRPDVAVVVFGETPYAEGRGDVEDLDFADEEPLALMRRLGEAGIPVVAVLLSGRPLWVDPELEASNAFVAAWLPGSEGGGLADVLFGAHDFTGRLPFSWPAAPDQTLVNVGDEDYVPRFPYGFGLSYGAERTAAHRDRLARASAQ